jgi:hypothetical protein
LPLIAIPVPNLLLAKARIAGIPAVVIRRCGRRGAHCERPRGKARTTIAATVVRATIMGSSHGNPASTNPGVTIKRTCHSDPASADPTIATLAIAAPLCFGIRRQKNS